MSRGEAVRDPFGVTVDLNAYFPRRVTEWVAAKLVRAVRASERPAAVTGPPGLGKTLMLHLLGDRLGHELRFVYLPYGSLPPAELCTWSLSRLLLPQSSQPIETLHEHATRLAERGAALLLLIDDVSGMPLETARWLGRTVSGLKGALRLVVAATDGARTGPVLEALHPEIEVVRLDVRLSESETREYVRARLEHARVPAATRALFDDAALDAVHRLSQGVPRQIHAVASAVMRGVSGERALQMAQRGQSQGAARGSRRRRDRRRSDALELTEVVQLPPAREEGEWVAATSSPTPRPVPRRSLEPPGRIRVWATSLLCVAGLVGVILARPPVPQPASPPPPTPAARPGGTGHGPARGPVAAQGPLDVQVSAVPWARIEVDGIDFGTRPLLVISLIPGPHRFRVRMPDGRILERVVEIDPRNRFVFFE